MSGKGDQKKSGGGSKIGRNKKKCESYRFTKAKGASVEGNKKPRGIGNLSKPRLDPRDNYVDELAFVPEDRIPTFRPVVVRPHLATELVETGIHRVGFKAEQMVGVGYGELTRHLRDPRALCHVRTIPRRDDNNRKKRGEN